MEIRRVARELAGIEHPKRNGAAAPADASCARCGDSVELSNAAKEFAAGREAGAEPSAVGVAVREERVRDVRERIVSGYYENNSEVRDVVLARLVESVLDLGEKA